MLIPTVRKWLLAIAGFLIFGFIVLWGPLCTWGAWE